MFQHKNIDIMAFTEVKNNYTLIVKENDGYPADYTKYDLSGYIYAPYNEIDPIRVNLTFNEDKMTIDSVDLVSLDFKKRYFYKVFITDLVDSSKKFIVQSGTLQILDEQRAA